MIACRSTACVWLEALTLPVQRSRHKRLFLVSSTMPGNCGRRCRREQPKDAWDGIWGGVSSRGAAYICAPIKRW